MTAPIRHLTLQQNPTSPTQVQKPIIQQNSINQIPTNCSATDYEDE